MTHGLLDTPSRSTLIFRHRQFQEALQAIDGAEACGIQLFMNQGRGGSTPLVQDRGQELRTAVEVPVEAASGYSQRLGDDVDSNASLAVFREGH